jgi:hypothetical protein
VTARFNQDRAEEMRQDQRTPPYGTWIDLEAGRKCIEWFDRAGIEPVHVDVRCHRMQHAGAEGMEPGLLDLLRWDEEPLPEFLKPAVENGLIDMEAVARAKREVEEWYRHPHAFHYWGMVFAAGRA